MRERIRRLSDVMRGAMELYPDHDLTAHIPELLQEVARLASKLEVKAKAHQRMAKELKELRAILPQRNALIQRHVETINELEARLKTDAFREMEEANQRNAKMLHRLGQLSGENERLKREIESLKEAVEDLRLDDLHREAD